MSKVFDKINSHPLSMLVQDYFSRYEELRDKYQDLDNIKFHTKNALVVSGPEEWPYYHCVRCVSDQYFNDHQNNSNNKIVVVYPSSDSYKELYEILGKKVAYVSMSEIYLAAARSFSNHSLQMNHIWSLLGDASITFVLNMDDVYNIRVDAMDHIKKNTNGALVILG